MTDRSRALYDAAVHRINSGRWIPNPDSGEILSLATGRPLKPQVNRHGYHSVGVRSPFTDKSHLVLLHRVMWEFVFGPIPDGLQVNHIDGDKSHNAIANLELCTAMENIRHAHRIGLFDGKLRGSARSNARLTEDQVREIRRLVAGGSTQTATAERYRISQSIVSEIVRHKRWTHVA